MKLFYYTVNIQHEVTDNNAVFSEDCKGSVRKSGDGGDDVIWENSLRSALLMISSMLKSVYETPRRTRKAFSRYGAHPVSIVSGKLTCKGR